MFMYECAGYILYGRNDLSSYYTPHYKLPGVMYAYVIISTTTPHCNMYNAAPLALFPRHGARCRDRYTYNIYNRGRDTFLFCHTAKEVRKSTAGLRDGGFLSFRFAECTRAVFSSLLLRRSPFSPRSPMNRPRRYSYVYRRGSCLKKKKRHLFVTHHHRGET